MCSHYEAPDSPQLLSVYGAQPDQQLKLDLWPGYIGPFVRRRSSEHQDGVEQEIEVMAGVFGLLPHWAKDQKLARKTYNARSESVAEKNSFRSAWREARHAIIPARAIYEPDWRSGKAVPTRITRKDGGLMGIAGLWERWVSPEGVETFSYTMLTINAADHPLMSQFHRPEDERRMVVILPNGLHADWLRASPEQSRDFLRQYPADRLHAESAA